jgi:hypothetical protein
MGIKKIVQGREIEFFPQENGGYVYFVDGNMWGIDDLSDESLEGIDLSI